jgi:hypothetical protein
MAQIELDPKLLATLKTLDSHAVEYVLVGEVAEAIHDGGGFISGVAIVPAPYGRNVDRLACALKALLARLSDGQSLDPRTTDLGASAPCTFKTAHADVELDFAPGGTKGYPDLFDDAARTPLAAGVNPHVASPQDLERIKRGARGAYGDAPPAMAPARPPVPPPREADEIHAARPPQALEPEPAGWPEEEIRARRATRR